MNFTEVLAASNYFEFAIPSRLAGRYSRKMTITIIIKIPLGVPRRIN